MKDQFKTKQVLIQELASLKRRIKELEQSESERKRNEEALRRAEENFRRSLDDSPLGIRIVTIDGETIYANRAILDIYSYEDLNTIPLKKRYTPESYAEYKIRREKRKRGDYVPSEYEISIIRKDGEVRNLQVYRKEILWDGERQFQVTYQDITERKRAEKALLESEEKYRYLVKHAPTGIYEIDLTARRFLSVNDAMCQYTGYTRKEFLSMDSVQFLTEESQRSLIQRHSKVLAGEPVPDSIELQIKRKNGSEFCGILNSRYFHEPNDRILSTGIVHDITERKRADNELRKAYQQLRAADEQMRAQYNSLVKSEQSMRESEEKYRNILENMAEGYFEIDLKGNMKFCNDSTCSISGYSQSELVNMNYRQYASPETVTILRAVYNNIYKTGEKGSLYDFELIRKDKQTRNMELSLNLMKNSEGEAIGFRCIARDITERKLAEQELKKAEESYRSIFENASEGIYQSTPDGKFLHVNPAMASIYGYESAEDMVQIVTDISTQVYENPYDREFFKETLQKHDRIEKYEYQIRKKNGNIIWVSNNARTVRDNEGRILYYEGMVDDITERKRAEEKLREAHRRLDEIIEFLPDATFVIDADSKVIAWNRAIEQMTGVPKAEMIGKGEYEYALPFYGERRPIFIDLALSPDAEFEKGKYDIAQRSTDTIYGETYVPKTYGGKGAYLSGAASRLRNAAGNIVGAIESIRDITDRKRAEEALNETNETLGAIIQSSPLAIISFDPEGNVTRWNPAAEKMFGWLESEVLGQFLPYISEDKRDEHLKLRERVLLGEGFTDVEARRRKKDGAPIDISVSTAPLRDSQGFVYGVMSVNVDITERKRAEGERRLLEERLQRAEKMQALGTLAGGVAHDLNNVLGVLVGYSELLMQNVPQDSPFQRHAMQIFKGGQRAAAIIQDLLTLTRRGVLVSEAVNLNRVISDFLQMPEFEAIKSHHPGVQFKTSLDAELLNMKGSSTHLNKTVMNLLSNAAEAISGSGEVLIRTENRYVDRPIHGYDTTQEGEYAVLTVSDTGSGISPADLGRIFEPFYTKKVMGRSGTGLGLAVVWGTVKDHDGYIDVQSTEGEGSIFTLYFPVTREALTKIERTLPQSEYMGRGEHILVVDDVEGQRLLASAMLESLGYKVDSVAGGKEAVEFVKKQPVDLLILDMIMDPGIDGLETYQRILEIRKDQKAIIVSGFSETERVHVAQSLGAGAYIRKPYVIEKLGLAVKKELNR